MSLRLQVVEEKVLLPDPVVERLAQAATNSPEALLLRTRPCLLMTLVVGEVEQVDNAVLDALEIGLQGLVLALHDLLLEMAHIVVYETCCFHIVLVHGALHCDDLVGCGLVGNVFVGTQDFHLLGIKYELPTSRTIWQSQSVVVLVFARRCSDMFLVLSLLRSTFQSNCSWSIDAFLVHAMYTKVAVKAQGVSGMVLWENQRTPARRHDATRVVKVEAYHRIGASLGYSET